MQSDFPERTIVHVLERRLADAPDKPWIVTGGRSYSFRDIDALSSRMAHGLAAAGLAPGDTLLAMLPDGIELITSWVACAKLGIIEVPVNTAYRGDILVHVANDSGARSMVVGGRYLDRVAAVEGELTCLERCFVQGDMPGLPAGRLAVRPFGDLLADDARPLGRPLRGRDHKAIMYTSGTTGKSKGVMVSHAHAHEYATSCGGGVELQPSDVYYSAGLPLFHVAGRWGVVYAAAIQGATAVVPDGFSTRDFWDDVRRHGCTATYLLGAMANFLQRAERRPDDAANPLAKVLMCPLLSDLDDFCRRFDLKVATAYGSTEVNAPIAMKLGTPVRDRLVVGKVRPDFEVRILDADDRQVAPGEVGEIAVRPKVPWITMLGYWNAPQATAAMWRNLWLHSGDAGRCDEDGNLYFIDRLKDAIRRRGENISSMEVEAIVSRHPAIQECAVFPVASEHTEQEVMVAIVLKPDQRLEGEALIRHLEMRMPHFMVPRYVDFVAELPKTATGKVRKHMLRDAGLTPTTWDRVAAGVKVAR